MVLSEKQRKEAEAAARVREIDAARKLQEEERRDGRAEKRDQTRTDNRDDTVVGGAVARAAAATNRDDTVVGGAAARAAAATMPPLPPLQLSLCLDAKLT